MKVVTRTSVVQFRIGQVVCHKLHHYRGVVIEWDPCAQVGEQEIHQLGVR